ncbi:glyoxalase-like domain protein [Mycobacterium ulcerans str. Harvey]|uniref:Glyoxalase-like domain protein n=1 Tax=Mycobacterium ulcerans str. Harvey TaxID=1299332 RepID=A0ABP3A4P0_MYCUL|nr:glyoxalase-like domain protein [Mycobacterium ulcerans str. Harvey]
MPIRNAAPLGAPCWIDLTTSDIDRAQDFYGTVFGWTFESAGPEYGGYVNAARNGHPVAGLMANNPEWQAPDNWTTYFHTADITAAAAAVTAAGGSRCVDPMEIPAKGFMCMATDPAGAFFGLWQPLGHRGFEIIGEAGAAVWHQLTTRDYHPRSAFTADFSGGKPNKSVTPTNSATPPRPSTVNSSSGSWTAPGCCARGCHRSGVSSSVPRMSIKRCR